MPTIFLKTLRTPITIVQVAPLLGEHGREIWHPTSSQGLSTSILPLRSCNLVAEAKKVQRKVYTRVSTCSTEMLWTGLRHRFGRLILLIVDRQGDPEGSGRNCGGAHKKMYHITGHHNVDGIRGRLYPRGNHDWNLMGSDCLGRARGHSPQEGF